MSYYGGAGGGAAVLSGYSKVLADIMSALGAGDANIEAHYSDGEYHGFLISRTHATTGSFRSSTATYTVPVGKKVALIEIGNADGLINGSGNEKIQLWNQTDGSVILPDSYFASAIRGIGIREGSWGVAGKEIQLRSYHGTTGVKPTGWLIFRVVDA